ncbi:MAG TPA: hypothetical protein VIA81_08600 [Acidimicrobiia bacterium]
MERATIERILSDAEASLTAGGPIDLKRLRFWSAVEAVKRQPALVNAYADRIGAIDRGAFERWVLLRIPIPVGNTLSIVVSLAGLALIGWAYRLTSLAQALALLAGTVIVMTATHGLTHLVVGAANGIGFTAWYVGAFARPTPGVKIDYASYLRASPTRRAWMHGSAALVTKLVPFLSLGAGWAMSAPGWAMALLGVIAIGQIVTDILWSTKSSDWKRFRREMALA